MFCLYLRMALTEFFEDRGEGDIRNNWCQVFFVSTISLNKRGAQNAHSAHRPVGRGVAGVARATPIFGRSMAKSIVGHPNFWREKALMGHPNLNFLPTALQTQ